MAFLWGSFAGAFFRNTPSYSMSSMMSILATKFTALNLSSILTITKSPSVISESTSKLSDESLNGISVSETDVSESETEVSEFETCFDVDGLFGFF